MLSHRKVVVDVFEAYASDSASNLARKSALRFSTPAMRCSRVSFFKFHLFLVIFLAAFLAGDGSARMLA
jgi:hypothetical protein